MKAEPKKHPTKLYIESYNNLVGLDTHKSKLLSILYMLLDKSRIEKWCQQHHKNALKSPIVSDFGKAIPLIILEGEVGCGKTALAQSIASVIAEKLDKAVYTYEAPTDIRGTGLVGDLSKRITEFFQWVKNSVLGNKNPSIIILDEADDLVTARSIEQSHHEDKAGVNVIIKQLDQLAEEKLPIAVIMITNRLDVLDPAIVRRSALILAFTRPDEGQRLNLVKSLLAPFSFTEMEISTVARSFAPKNGILYSYSDIYRVVREVLAFVITEDKPLLLSTILSFSESSKPTPLLK